MTNTSQIYRPLQFATERQLVVDAGRRGSRRHIMYGLLELDVSKPREFMRLYKTRTGESLSFTAFVVCCLAHVVGATPSVQAFRNWRNQLILFEDVDVVVVVESQPDVVALPHIIRAANRKNFWQIHAEIRDIQNNQAQSSQPGALAKLGLKLPAFVRDVAYWAFLQNPHWFKKVGGTVAVSSVGMFFDGSGWGISFLPFHTLGVTVGGIAEKPVVVNSHIEVRQCLNLTICLDHDIVDGAPAARFAREFKHLIEMGYGLGE